MLEAAREPLVSQTSERHFVFSGYASVAGGSICEARLCLDSDIAESVEALEASELFLEEISALGQCSVPQLDFGTEHCPSADISCTCDAYRWEFIQRYHNVWTVPAHSTIVMVLTLSRTFLQHVCVNASDARHVNSRNHGEKSANPHANAGLGSFASQTIEGGKVAEY